MVVSASSSHKTSQIMFGAVVLLATLFSTIYATAVFWEAASAHLGPFALILVVFKTLVEVAASYYGFGLLFTASHYLWWRDSGVSAPTYEAFPPVAVLYLCCNDLDIDALASLASLRYRGELYLVVHDDSTSQESRAEVDRALNKLRSQTTAEIMLLRRPHKEGGKPAATNYVLSKIGHLAEYVLICDNDSTILDPLTIEAALPYFADPSVAVVQCRNVSVQSPSSCRVNRLLARSIDAFNVFLVTHARFGWQPFIGHNAMLKTSTVLKVGGFTPGFFSDDLDLTVRLNLAGFRVAYAPSIQMGEKHPPSYHAFRTRAYKWAYGCVQTLRAHSWSVLRSSRLSAAEKFSFFQFTGFYIAQSMLLLYLIVTFLIGPWVLRNFPVSFGTAFFAGTVIILTTYAPVLAYFARDRTRGSWLGTVLLCGLVYGSSDFATTRGVWDCLRRRARSWVPTNSRSSQARIWPLVGEAIFGGCLLLSPLLASSPVLFLPASYIFAGKFLWGPAISILYDDDRRGIPRRDRKVLRMAQAAVLLFTLALLASFLHSPVRASQGGGVQIRGTALLVDGEPFQVKGVHYGPWRSGTGPDRQYPYPSREQIDSDLKLIKGLNANTILVVDAPAYVLDTAEKNALKVLYCFTINWWALGKPEDNVRREAALARVEELRSKPALLGWVLGNEIPGAALDNRGQERIRAGLRGLYDSIKQLDPHHPVTHSNWPITKDLDLSFLDFVSFNVYPLWPPEVVARGFGSYVKDVLLPLGESKPLLITEFGVNTLEAGDEGQAKILRSCWDGLTGAGTSGGIVFEFADEWWKNYDNPRREGNWWDRQPAPDDEKRHDRDPEEYYGILTEERNPRPAAAVVREMFSVNHSNRTFHSKGMVPGVVVAVLLISACLGWIFAVRFRDRRSRDRRLRT